LTQYATRSVHWCPSFKPEIVLAESIYDLSIRMGLFFEKPDVEKAEFKTMISKYLSL
jgi:hypothetical protein